MDNVWETLHTALFLAHLMREKWQEIDTLYLMKKILFSSLSDLVLSDINAGTKSYIKKMNPEIFTTLYAGAYQYFLDGMQEQTLKDDMQHTFTRTDREVEDQIILTAKKYVWYIEAMTNSRVFSEIYEVPISIIQDELEILSQQLPAFQTLLDTPNYEKYLAYIFRLISAMRWNQYTRNTPISVMSHTVVVMYLSYIIGMIGNMHGEKNDIADMMLRAVYHDVPEVITWDIITPTKEAVPGFRKLLEEIEENMLEDYLFSYIPQTYVAYLHPYILHPFEDVQGKKTKYADTLSALLEAQTERENNPFFESKYQEILPEVQNNTHPWVAYVLQEVSSHFNSSNDVHISPVKWEKNWFSHKK